MKNYFLKIAGLSTIAIPLVVAVACSESPENTKDKKDKAIDIDLIGAQNKIVNVESYKNRAQLEIALDGKEKGAIVTKDEIGYIEPTNLPNGVTIDSEKYTLEELMAAHANKFKVKVILTKVSTTTIKTATKIITITAKPYDFTAVKSKFTSPATSSKTKAELTGIVGKKAGTAVVATDMGYAEPSTGLDGVTVTYTIKQVFNDVDKTFKVKATLTKGSGTTAETTTKDITITAATSGATTGGTGSK